MNVTFYWIGVLSLISVFVLIVIFYFNNQKQNRQDIRSNKLKQFKASGFKSTIKFKLPHCFIAVDDNNKNWFVIDKYNPKSSSIHSFTEIIDVEIIKNDKTVVSTNTSSSIGRGLVGGMLFGTTGALVGGSTATKTMTTDVTKLGIRIVLDDIKNPMVYINCLNAEQQIDEIYSTFLAIYKSNK